MRWVRMVQQSFISFFDAADFVPARTFASGNTWNQHQLLSPLIFAIYICLGGARFSIDLGKAHAAWVIVMWSGRRLRAQLVIQI